MQAARRGRERKHEQTVKVIIVFPETYIMNDNSVGAPQDAEVAKLEVIILTPSRCYLCRHLAVLAHTVTLQSAENPSPEREIARAIASARRDDTRGS